MPKFQPTLSEQKLPLVEHVGRGWIDYTYLAHPCRTTIPTARPLQQQRQPIQVSHWTGAKKVVPVCSLRNALQARHSPHQQRGFDETVLATTERTSGVADALRCPLACGVRCAARSVSPHPFSARHSPGKSNKTSVPARSWRSLVHTFPPLSLYAGRGGAARAKIRISVAEGLAPEKRRTPALRDRLAASSRIVSS